MSKHRSIQLTTPCEYIDIVPLNPLVSKCQIKVLYVGEDPNRNGTIITKEVAKEIAASLPTSPIVGYYNESAEDFESHNELIEFKGNEICFKDTTVPYGFVPPDAKVWFQKYQDDDSVEREYLLTEGYLWTGQYPECKRILEQGNNQSMELDENYIKGSWSTPNNEGQQFFIINEAIISKLCILGEDVEPCFEGAQIGRQLQFSYNEDFNKKLYSVMTKITELLQEGGEHMADYKDKNQEEVCPECGKPLDECTCEKKKKFAKGDDKEEKEVCPECGKPLDECTCKKGEDKSDKYNLSEIPEYVELKNNYDTLNSSFAALKEEVESLRIFKLNAEREEKEEMINSFYMLSDEDKKDVKENIDKYSLGDIEAKLSVICVRNKVSFDLDKDEKEEKPQMTYSLDDGDDNDNVPAWIKAMRQVAKEI